MRIVIANPVEVDAIWPSIANKMQEGCDRTGNGISSGELWQMARSGNGYLIVVLDDEQIICASVWRFENWADGSVFRCMGLCGKDMRKWVKPLFDFAQQMKRDGGAMRLIAQGRKGWDRAVKIYANVQMRTLWQCYEVM